MINIKEIIDSYKDCVVIKKSPDYPNYQPGDDVDIFCRSLSEMVYMIMLVGRKYMEEYTVVKKTYQDHTHIDFMKDNKLEIRFDLIENLDCYKDALLADNEYAQLAVRLLDFAQNPNKTKHLEFVKDVLSR